MKARTAMPKCQFEIINELGKVERVEVDASRILVGSAAHCDIRLAPEVGAYEHLVVTFEEGAAIARVLPTAASATVDGTVFRETRLHDGAVVAIGLVRLRYQSLAAEAPASRRRVPRFAVLGLLVFLPAALFVLVNARGDARLREPSSVPLPLGAVVRECPATTREQAHALARERSVSANAKRQRWKFYTRDGVESVALYESAAACAAAAGETGEAKATAVFAAAMRADVLQDFQVRRVRLERALERDDGPVALTQVRALREMLFARDIDDEYVRWLTILQRKLEARVSRST